MLAVLIKIGDFIQKYCITKDIFFPNINMGFCHHLFLPFYTITFL